MRTAERKARIKKKDKQQSGSESVKEERLWFAQLEIEYGCDEAQHSAVARARTGFYTENNGSDSFSELAERSEIFGHCKTSVIMCWAA